jgi:predicted secreted protein
MMRSAKPAVVIFIFLLILASSALAKGSVIYENKEFDYSVLLPGGYAWREIPPDEPREGVELRKGEGMIDVRAMGAGTMYEKMPFDEYVKIAALSQIQNYEELVSIESFVSDYGIKGYKTYWEAGETVPPDEDREPEMSIVGPIYYFPLSQEKKSFGHPVKTVMISYYEYPNKKGNVPQDAEQIARSYRYLDTYKGFFKEEDNGREFVVARGETFRIQLSANPTTGYSWGFDDLDQGSFEIVSSGYNPPLRKLVGAGGTSWWSIKPLRSGEKEIKLLYFRPWEGKEKAVERFKIDLLVK